MHKYLKGIVNLVVDVYLMKSTVWFENNLEDNIHKWGAMNQLVTDSTTVEISPQVKYI